MPAATLATGTGTSSSGGFAITTLTYWLYDQIQGPVGGTNPDQPTGAPQTFYRVALVNVETSPGGPPPIVLFGGNYYYWSTVRGCYLKATPYQATGAPGNTALASPVAGPIG